MLGSISEAQVPRIKSAFASPQSTQRARRPVSGLQIQSAPPGGAPSTGFVVWTRSQRRRGACRESQRPRGGYRGSLACSGSASYWGRYGGGDLADPSRSRTFECVWKRYAVTPDELDPQFLPFGPGASKPASDSYLWCKESSCGSETETHEDSCVADAPQSTPRFRVRDSVALEQRNRWPQFSFRQSGPCPFRDPSKPRQFGAGSPGSPPCGEPGSRPAEDRRPLECAARDVLVALPPTEARRSPPCWGSGGTLFSE